MADFAREERLSLKVIPCYDGLVRAIHELPLLLRSPASAYLRVTRLRVTALQPALRVGEARLPRFARNDVPRTTCFA